MYSKRLKRCVVPFYLFVPFSILIHSLTEDSHSKKELNVSHQKTCVHIVCLNGTQSYSSSSNSPRPLSSPRDQTEHPQQIRRQTISSEKSFSILFPSSSHSIRSLFFLSFNYVCVSAQELHKKNVII
ncbi:hypothetical protein CDAR_85291 [Caerostris darwini]|uniref:Secreted protein n=1 Tax=Caerostris darwini TaxID=1538125 RepID=A0AAV4T678_9ARAC|nr:hypothetical protein CDAR_85291 [Caerostris darwini]